MDANLYQMATRRTRPGQDRERALACFGLGVAGEAGEVADLVKKALFHGHDIDPVQIKKELGDVLWYVAALADEYGLTLSEVMEANIAKLEARYPSGFTTDDSRNRTDDR